MRGSSYRTRNCGLNKCGAQGGLLVILHSNVVTCWPLAAAFLLDTLNFARLPDCPPSTLPVREADEVGIHGLQTLDILHTLHIITLGITSFVLVPEP